MTDYTIANLDDVEDAAAKRGLTFGSSRFPRTVVGAEQTGFAHLQMLPGAHQSFGHRHEVAEEIYFVISGSGAVKLDDGVHELHTHDILRAAPQLTRCFEGGPEGMELLAFGPHHPGDGELIQGYWES